MEVNSSHKDVSVVSVGTKPPLVYIAEALNQKYYFSATKSL